jgi:hypothetical protein
MPKISDNVTDLNTGAIFCKSSSASFPLNCSSGRTRKKDILASQLHKKLEIAVF